MDLAKLPKITEKPAKRVGRGMGSGKGSHTTGRGQKGQKARGGVRVSFEGTKSKKSLLKRVPMLRGKGRQKVWQEKPEILNLADLADWPEKDAVNVKNLVKSGYIKSLKVKILGEGEVKKALIVEIPVSESAAAKITAAGGKIVS